MYETALLSLGKAINLPQNLIAACAPSERSHEFIQRGQPLFSMDYAAEYRRSELPHSL
jgi:hypothetical protein